MGDAAGKSAGGVAEAGVGVEQAMRGQGMMRGHEGQEGEQGAEETQANTRWKHKIRINAKVGCILYLDGSFAISPDRDRRSPPRGK